MPKEISAYDFVQTINRLNPNNFIERLLEHTRKSETYYLELKELCEQKNIDTTGMKKADLVSALEK